MRRRTCGWGRPEARAALFVGLAAGLLAGASPAAVARTWVVRAQERTGAGSLPEALHQARAGDVVLAEPGTYRASLLEVPSGVTLRSRLGASQTILQGDTTRSILLVRAADSMVTVEGFTFTRGGATRLLDRHAVGGGAILSEESELQIRNNVFRGNRLRGKNDVGGAIALFGGHALIENNRFENNSASRGGAVFAKGDAILVQNEFVGNRCKRHGGALMIEKAVARVERNIFERNYAGWGGGICVGHLTEATLLRNTLVRNRSHQWGGGIFLMDCEPILERNLLVENRSDFRGGGLAGGIFSYPVLKNNLGWHNTPWNFRWVEDTLEIPQSTHQLQLDPQLKGLARGDLHPRLGGPAAGRWGVIGALDPAPEPLLRRR